MENDKEKQIEDLENIRSWYSIFSLIIFIGLVVWFFVFIALDNLSGVVMAASAYVIVIIISTFVNIKMMKRINILRGYYIDDGVKYFVDSKGKVVRKVQGKITFEE